jgi:tetratricopeptide (TPR) repeat protein
MSNLAEIYGFEGKYPQAEALFNETRAMMSRVLGPENNYRLANLIAIAFMYQRQGKYALAETYAAESLAGRRHALGPEHPDTLDSATSLALAYESQGKFAESEALARQTVAFDRKIRPDDWRRFHAESVLGATLAGQKKYAEAEPLLVESYRGMMAREQHITVPARYDLDNSRAWLVQLYEAWGKPEKAAEWRLK